MINNNQNGKCIVNSQKSSKNAC